MLPNTEANPTVRDESCVLPSIPLAVSGELGCPVVGVRLRCRAMNGTGVPEASINEDRHFGARENDVWPESHAAEIKPVVLPEPVSSGVQGRAEGNFRLCVGAAVPLHRPPSTFRRRPRLCWHSPTLRRLDVSESCVVLVSHPHDHSVVVVVASRLRGRRAGDNRHRAHEVVHKLQHADPDCIEANAALT